MKLWQKLYVVLIIPILLILFRRGGILSSDWSDAHVYDCEAGRRKMGTV